MRWHELTRTSAFRWTLAGGAVFAGGIVLIFGFLYWQTAVYFTSRIDTALTREAGIMAAEPAPELLEHIAARIGDDPRRIKLAGLFDAGGGPVAGNLAAMPAGVRPGSGVATAVVIRRDGAGTETQTVRAIAVRLGDGTVLVLGRNVDEITEFSEIVLRALALGLGPATVLALAGGALLAFRGQRRIEAIHRAARRIMAGHLGQRLQARRDGDDVDKLAAIVNGMLDEIERLMMEVKGVGDDIAHDLRTPLTRVRMALERGRNDAATVEALRAVVDRAITGIDHALGIITALLRIAEIEQGRRRAGFASVDLAEIVREVADLYEPIAEDRGLDLRVEAASVPAWVRGDRDLLFEALANLVDNAVKFTPAGGRVVLALAAEPGGNCILRVSDTGPGIPQAERDAVLRRFYRSDPSRAKVPGTGLGLSLVAAIASLHGFTLDIAGEGGCTVTVGCSPAAP